MRLIPSLLVYGFKTNSIEDVREKLEAAFGVRMRVFRDDDDGPRYASKGRDPVPPMTLYPNYDSNEGDPVIPEEEFEEFPVILSVTSWEKLPNFRDIINTIPDFGAELLREFDEMEFDDKELNDEEERTD